MEFSELPPDLVSGPPPRNRFKLCALRCISGTRPWARPHALLQSTEHKSVPRQDVKINVPMELRSLRSFRVGLKFNQLRFRTALDRPLKHRRKAKILR
jgi:hypothetical protein